MIAHRLSTVRNCDMIIVLKHGQIVEQGTHDELLLIEGGFYRNLWEKQSEQIQKENEDIQVNEEQDLPRNESRKGNGI